MKSNIILIGLPGAGKTTVGTALAKELNIPFYDTDHLLEEKHQKKCSELYKELGEERFRACELEILQNLSPEHPAVISVGGGLPEIAEASHWLDNLGICFYLHEEVAVVVERRSQRPLPKFANDWEHYRTLITQRIPHYEALADYTVECLNRSPEMIVAEIESILRNLKL